MGLKYHVYPDKVLHGTTLGEMTKDGWGLESVGLDLDWRCRLRADAERSCLSEEIEYYAPGQ